MAEEELTLAKIYTELRQSYDRDTARVGVDKLKGKLSRVNYYLMSQLKLGSTDADASNIRHAIRIVNSRVRMLERRWQAVWGEDIERKKAVAELVADNDNGDLITFVSSLKHTKGHLSCPACTCSYDAVLPTPLSRLCPHCNHGIQHAYRVEKFTSIDGPPDENGNPLEQYSVETHLTCDRCGKTDRQDDSARPEGV